MEKKRLFQKAAKKSAEQRARDAVNEDFAEAPSEQYDASGMAEAVNAVTKSGEPGRRMQSEKQLRQAEADKKAYDEMMANRKKALFHRKK